MAVYHDAAHFDVLQDERAEVSIGTGEPVSLAEYIRTEASPSRNPPARDARGQHSAAGLSDLTPPAGSAAHVPTQES